MRTPVHHLSLNRFSDKVTRSRCISLTSSNVYYSAGHFYLIDLENNMTNTIQVRLTDQRCELGDAYAQKHWTIPPKIAVLSCEGMCLRGEVARRAANLIAHELNKTAKIMQ